MIVIDCNIKENSCFPLLFLISAFSFKFFLYCSLEHDPIPVTCCFRDFWYVLQLCKQSSILELEFLIEICTEFFKCKLRIGTPNVINLIVTIGFHKLRIDYSTVKNFRNLLNPSTISNIYGLYSTNFYSLHITTTTWSQYSWG